MAIRLGEVLVRQGLLDAGQVERVLERQRETRRPFGVLAEELFGLSEEQIEGAWAEQYAELTAGLGSGLGRPEAGAREAVTRRQAWQFNVLPVRYEDGELVLATTKANLPRALRFAVRVLGSPCFFVLVEPRVLGELLVEFFPMAGMTAGAVPIEHAKGAGV